MKRTFGLALTLVSLAAAENCCRPSISALMEHLGHEDPAVREAASADLAALGAAALPEMERRLADPKLVDPEVEVRLAQLVAEGRHRIAWRELWEKDPRALAKWQFSAMTCASCGSADGWVIEQVQHEGVTGIFRNARVFIGSCHHEETETCNAFNLELALVFGAEPDSGVLITASTDSVAGIRAHLVPATDCASASRSAMALATLATSPRQAGAVLDEYSAGEKEPIGPGELEVKWMGGGYMWLFTFDESGVLLRATLDERHGC